MNGIALLQLSDVFNYEHQKCPVCQDTLRRKVLVIEVSHLDFKHFVLFIYSVHTEGE